ncbi:NAD(P)H-dependent oxidoreductase [Methanocella arvoryzae]|uniref:Predicted redox-active protein (CxxC motif) n=1 Tax=Methanocella arvoryzae (strain DSM 22066 / NBRC 105507 / MRE50) TaxID=351160 RepID=Q0W3G2_METAR|nr:NAD(P)H-dependent oxidoreductase [Methanocella arvoryzae]CAJ37081.1 predicted redox-active protein (CxxC motif) [Methanocella arvoryzae MRE50]
MKIIAIMGSPKGKGSGYKVVRMVEERMKRKGEVDFDYVFLKDANLQLCKGCFACVTKGKEYHYETRINPIKKAAVNLVVSLVMNMMKDMGPGEVQWPPKQKEA